MERPLTGEPLAVDLVNTRWRGPHGDEDMLATDEGADLWLAEHGLAAGAGQRQRMLRALRLTREALLHAFRHEAGSADEVNAVLARALLVRSLDEGRMREHPVFADESWRPAWLAADDYAHLCRAGADSVRQCAGDACVLYFFDPTGRRRWCSMARCGNRAKARRHYTRRLAAPGD